MVQGLLTADSARRIEAEHLGEEVNGQRVCAGEEGREWDARVNWERSNIILRLEWVSA